MVSRALALVVACLWLTAALPARAAGTPTDPAATRRPDDRVRQATALMQDNQLDAARAVLDAAIAAAPDDAAAWSRRAELDVLQGRVDDAIADASHVIRSRAGSDLRADAYLTRVTAWGMKDDDAKMLADMDSGAALAPTRSDFLERRALWALERRRWDQAKDAATRALAIDPHCASCQAERACAEANLDERDAALADGRAAVDIGPDDVMARMLYGDTLARLGNHPAAIDEFGKALAIDPHDQRARFHRGDSYLRVGDLAAAIADYTMVLEQGPYSERSLVFLHRGVALRSAHEPSRALADLRQAAELEPKQPYAQTVLGIALEESGDTPGAIAAYERATALEPGGQGTAMQGRLQMISGHFADAIEPLRATVLARGLWSSTYGPLWIYQSRLRTDVADEAEARAELARLAPPHEPRTWTDSLADYMLGRIDAATLQQRAQDGPQDKRTGWHCEADYYIAEIELAHGHREAALPLLDEAVRICPASFNEALGAWAERRRQSTQ